MTTSCQVCGRGSPNAFLCRECTSELRDNLRGLAVGWEVENTHRAYRTGGYLEWLEDAALGRTRLGESARRSTEMNSPVPFNSRAGELLQAVHNTLVGWVHHVCKSQGDRSTT